MAERDPSRGYGGTEAFKAVPSRAMPPAALDGSRWPEATSVPAAAADQGPVSLVLRPRRTRAACLLLVSLAFVGAGLGVRTPVVLLAAAFFGICAAAFAVMLLPGSTYLRLDADGFTVCSLYRARRVPWEDTGPFGVTQVSGQVMVGFDSARQAESRPWLTAMNSGLSGYSSTLPDTYGLGAPALATLMNEARRRALASRG